MGPPLIAAYGLGLAVAGVFRTDPAWGYPPGTPDRLPERESLASALHGVGFVLVFVSLVAACAVLARAFAARDDRPWSIAAMAVALALPVLLALSLLLGVEDPQPLSLLLRCTALVGWGFAALVALRVRAGLDRRVGVAV